MGHRFRVEDKTRNGGVGRINTKSKGSLTSKKGERVGVKTDREIERRKRQEGGGERRKCRKEKERQRTQRHREIEKERERRRS